MSLPILNPQQVESAAFAAAVRGATGEPLRALTIGAVQVNIGLRCNLACKHCHVESSPKRSEEMTWETMRAVLQAAQRAGADLLDITGGAPEMHSHFRPFVDAALAQGLRVMVRTNLTIMLDEGYTDLPAWFAERRVHLVASLPCYLPTNVDRQRGRHVYRDSVRVIQLLNEQGSGRDADKPLDLVYNPLGPSLPPPQAALEADYRRALGDEFGIEFHRLFTITNLPIGRFQDDLVRSGRDVPYAELLRTAFNEGTLPGLMCRHQLHVGWDGQLHDCDFNFAIGLPARGAARHVAEFEPAAFLQREIAVGDHCFGCTAGCGSSCGGAIVATT